VRGFDALEDRESMFSVRDGLVALSEGVETEGEIVGRIPLAATVPGLFGDSQVLFVEPEGLPCVTQGSPC